MYSGTTSIKQPSGGGTPTAGHVDGQPPQDPRDSDFALQGHALHRTHAIANDGATAYRLERWGLVRCLPIDNAIEQFRIRVLLKQSADLTRLIGFYHEALTRAVLRGDAKLIAGWARAIARAGASLSAAQVATRMAPSAGRS